MQTTDAIEGDDAAADDAHVGGYAGRRKRRAAEMASEGESDSDDDTQGRKDRGRRGAPGMWGGGVACWCCTCTV